MDNIVFEQEKKRIELLIDVNGQKCFIDAVVTLDTFGPYAELRFASYPTLDIYGEMEGVNFDWTEKCS